MWGRNQINIPEPVQSAFVPIFGWDRMTGLSPFVIAWVTIEMGDVTTIENLTESILLEQFS